MRIIGKAMSPTIIYFNPNYFDPTLGGGSFAGTMDDIPDGQTYIKTHNDFTDDNVSTLGSALQTETEPLFSGWDKDYNDLINKPESGVTLLDVYPIGSIYISVDSTNPGTLFGGTWAAFGAGKTLIGIDSNDTDFDTVEETGGAKTVQSSAQSFSGTQSTTVVNHVHTLATGTGSSGNFAQVIGTVDASSGGTGATPTQTALATRSGNPVSGGAASYTPAGTNTPGAATSVVQPYIVVYMFKRTL